MTRRFFITATGTDVGKTFLTCHLLRHLRAAGRSVQALKPLICGYDPADASNDVAQLIEASGLPVNEDTVKAASLYRLKAPLSPDMAAKRENVVLDFEAMVAFCQWPSKAEVVLIEGAGGVMSPHAEGKTNLDLIAGVGVPVLLLAGNYLGSISHLLTAHSTLRARGVNILTVVISESAGGSVPLMEVASTVREYLPEPIVTVPRHIPADGAVTEVAQMIVE